MKKLLLVLCLLISFNSNAQFLKELYKDFLKYGTFYVAGDASNAYEQTYKDYFVERPADDDLYGIPKVIDVTNYYPMDYRVGLGFRKLARFGYEVKAKDYYDGTENNKSLSAPTVIPESLTIPSVPVVVSLALDLKKFAAAIPPNLSASVAVPANFISLIAVERVIPFVIVANPLMALFGVNVSSEMIAIKFPSLNNFVMFWVVSVESAIESKINPLFVPVALGGPTNMFVDPL